MTNRILATIIIFLLVITGLLLLGVWFNFFGIGVVDGEGIVFKNDQASGIYLGGSYINGEDGERIRVEGDSIILPDGFYDSNYEIVEEYDETELQSGSRQSGHGGDECVIDSDCGDDSYSDDFCYFGDVYRNSYEYSCNNGFCSRDRNKELVDECNLGCDDDMCVVEICLNDMDCDTILDWDEDVDGNNDLSNDDTDRDGLPNYLDSDDDNDGILTKNENSGDSDGDSVPNYLEPNNIDLDLDSFTNNLDSDDDGDSIPTKKEDVNGDGNVLNDDSDDDGINNYLDDDDDNDNVLTKEEDSNGDGDLENDDNDGDSYPNYLDGDDDNDGILTRDEDANGNNDPRDDDLDNDSVPDYLEPNNFDLDGDGLMNVEDDNDDGDLLLTINEDPNNDNNVLNDDSDNDGKLDFLDNDDQSVITCTVDLECGIDDFVGDTYCINDNVYQNYKSFMCLDSGTFDSVCSTEVSPTIVEGCSLGCYQGACITEICDNGIDDDGNGLVDGLTNGDPNNGNQGSFGGLNNIYTIPGLVNQAVIDKGLPINHVPNVIRRTAGSWDANTHADHATLDKVCEIFGYDNVVSSSCNSAQGSGCNFHSPGNNIMYRWDGNAFTTVSAWPKYGNSWLTQITCRDSLLACNDGVDNDNDGLVDMADDGCDNPNDDSEIPHDPICEL